jgi:outer membrane protein assembly factor BamB
VPGPTLQELAGRDGPLGEPRLRALAAGLAEALASIHAAGVVHADLTPRNIIMAQDGPRVIDFGISRALKGSAATGVLGTPGYLSPEQVASGRVVGPASDVFTLGAVLVFAATGQPPFGAGLPASQLYRVVHEEPDLDGVPAPLSPLIRACMAKRPEARPVPQAILAAVTSPAPAPAGLAVPVASGASSAGVAVPAGVGYPSAPGYAPTQTVLGGPADPGRPAAPGQGPVPFRPDGAPPRSAPSRRLLLGLAGGAAVAAAAGLAAALAESRNGSGSAGSGSGRTASGNAGSASWSQAPQLSPSAGSQSASLATLGGAVIWYGDSMALAYDGSTGDLLWSGAGKTPSRAADPRWLGVYGTALVGSVGLGQGATASTQLFGLERGGSTAFSVPVPTNVGGGLEGLNSGVALIAQYSPPALCANSTSSGRNLWSYPWSATTTSAASDDQHAYAYSDLNLTALNLRSGAKIWTTPVSAAYGAGTHDYTIFLGGGVVLLVGDTGVFAYDPASGKQLWKSGRWSPYALSDSAIYALSTDYADGPTIASLSPRTGQPRWRYQLTAFTQFASVPAIAPLQSNADLQVVALPCGAGSSAGLVVLDAATGKPLWAHSISLPSGSDSLLVAASGTSVFAATPATLYGFTG